MITKMTFLFFRFVFVALVLAIAAMYVFQRKMIYHPLQSSEIPENLTLRGIKPLKFTTSAGKQTAYFVPPIATETTATRRLWVCFPGNQGQAVHFERLIDLIHSPNTGFLLVSYPGYGVCEGNPTRKSIMETVYSILDVCREQVPDFFSHDENVKIGVIGYSLGTAIGLEFATLQSEWIKDIYLICPFTSLHDMAKQIIGYPLCHLLRDNYESLSILKKLAEKKDFHCVVFAGKKDEMVPFAQEQTMGTASPNVELIVFEEGTHWTTYIDALPVIAKRIDGMENNYHE